MDTPQRTPVTPRELAAANARLVTALGRHRAAKKALATAERTLADARRDVARMLEHLARAAIQPAPLCGRSGWIHDLGADATCPDCQAFGLIPLRAPGLPHAHPENP